ncbi:hypothetical protein [Candidatus Thiodictyon syntrophicum]|jgi:restriction endonuclease S subunit|uniref:hypothetical protein n=1 Tax=Candidatus Thiodictyon syntrophicum TaxID=1166950 RepID=UPI0012FD127C|nr:hypothetical protein [Candidatus Thiodictyon syntrophicum]
MKPSDALPHPSGWQTEIVGNAIEIKRGVSWSKDQEHSAPYDGAVRVIGISNVQERLDLDKTLYISGVKPKAVEKKRLEKGWSVIVGSNGNRQRIGNAVFIAEDSAFLFASFLIAAKPKQESPITPEFFFRWLRTEQVQAYLSASSEGSTGLSNLSHSFFVRCQLLFRMVNNKPLLPEFSMPLTSQLIKRGKLRPKQRAPRNRLCKRCSVKGFAKSDRKRLPSD